MFASRPGLNPAAATLLRHFGNSIFPAFQCLSEEILKAVGPFYLVSMPLEGKHPTSLHKPLARNGNFFKNAVINIFFTVTSKMAQLHIFRGLWFRLA